MSKFCFFIPGLFLLPLQPGSEDGVDEKEWYEQEGELRLLLVALHLIHPKHHQKMQQTTADKSEVLIESTCWSRESNGFSSLRKQNLQVFFYEKNKLKIQMEFFGPLVSSLRLRANHQFRVE
jgi:hypothetical protein